MRALSTLTRNLILLAAFACNGFADEFPSRPIHIVVPYGAGSTADLRARQIAKPLTDRLGVPIVIDNKPGASATIGNAFVAHAKADGYTLLFVNNASLCIAPHLVADLPYDSSAAFAPITQVAIGSAVLVVAPASGTNSVKALVAAAKSRPGELTYGSSGIGSVQHLPAALFTKLAGIDMLHIPYKSDTETILDLTNGRISMSIATLTGAIPHLKSGKLKALAVTTRQRLSLFADIPTMAEAGYPDFEWHNWFGFVAPVGTPSAIIDKLQKEITAVFEDAALRTEYLNAGYEIVNSSPEAFAALLKKDHERYGKLIRDIGLKAQ
jgi:tripartite-type tricarboxylate transporter receptor subunit TctC